MAKYERNINANFDEVLNRCNTAIIKGSVSATYEDGSNYELSGYKVSVRVYERYSYFGGNRVSLSLTLIGNQDHTLLTAITSGGSKATFFKINTLGESAFLEKFASELEKYYPKK